MDYILATDWLQNAYPEEKEKKELPPDDKGDDDDDDKENKDPADQMSWLQIVDDEEVRQQQDAAMEVEKKEDDGEKKPTSPNATTKPKCSCKQKVNVVPLLDHLCRHFNCTLRELNVLFQNLQTRREIAQHLRSKVQLRTNHMKPVWRNFNVTCNEVTIHSANDAFAMGGYLGITVRMYFYVKHRMRLSHSQLPCVMQFGGGRHRDLFPMECLSVIIQNNNQ